jgi:predicted O-methyltransferase YrrM
MIASEIQAAFNSTNKDIRESLRNAYEKYISQVSERDMAISMETAVLTTVLCNVFKPRNALDLGSGFSSYVLRKYKAEHDEEMHVFSVDSDEKWLDKSRQFCLDNDLDGENFVDWETLQDEGGVFDLVLFDIDHPPARRTYFLPTIRRHTSKSSIMIIDDFHFPKYRLYLLDALTEFDHEFINGRKYTFDEFGRYSVVVAGLR